MLGDSVELSVVQVERDSELVILSDSPLVLPQLLCTLETKFTELKVVEAEGRSGTEVVLEALGELEPVGAPRVSEVQGALGIVAELNASCVVVTAGAVSVTEVLDPSGMLEVVLGLLVVGAMGVAGVLRSTDEAEEMLGIAGAIDSSEVQGVLVVEACCVVDGLTFTEDELETDVASEVVVAPGTLVEELVGLQRDVSEVLETSSSVVVLRISSVDDVVGTLELLRVFDDIGALDERKTLEVVGSAEEDVVRLNNIVALMVVVVDGLGGA
ncbi:hypothetical protein VTO42DRAFT_1703 [Malbranchea cinnamomea]